jgi:predicted negative regulator of RcsB-dependent stress response
MARHPGARRVQRPQQPAHSDDVFVERVLETSAWAKENSTRLIIGGIVVVLVLLLSLYYRNYRADLRERSETQLSAIRTTVLSGNAALAIRDLETYMSSYGETQAGREARLLLGRAHLDNGEPLRAIEVLSGNVTDLGEPLGVAGALLLAAAFEAAGQADQAVTEYLRIAGAAPHAYQQHDALEAAGRIRLQSGDPQGAVEIYDRLLAAMPDSDPQKAVIELRRGEAAARVRGTAPSSS